jgi:hypothetical protein
MKIIAACEDTGALKVIFAQHGTDTSKPSDETNPQFPVTITTHATGYNRKSKILNLIHSEITGNIIVSRLNGSVESYDTSHLIDIPEIKEENNDKENIGSEEKTDLLPLLQQHKALIPSCTSKDDERFVSLLVDETGRILAVTNKGSLFIWKSEDQIKEDPIKYQLPLNLSEIIEVFQIHPGKENINYIAYGGKETDLRIIKLPESIDNQQSEKKELEIFFKAKNVSDSKLNLRVPIHIKNILFDKSSTPENFKLYTFTEWGNLRYYESKAGRKPRTSFLILPKKAPIVKAVWLGEDFVVCDNKGLVIKVESSTGRQICQFKGQIGSTQALHNFKDSILATTGFDRYIRAYNNKNRECIVKVFIGEQSNALAIIEDKETLKRTTFTILGDKARESIRRKEIKENENENEEREESDDDELWSKLESNITQRRKRRKLTLV